ncbi:MAG: FtsW/RodA/SpoVE family cell cycle protein, partial [Chloroflexota bacterium]
MTRPIQARLLRWAAAFLFLYSLILTLSPSVRERSLEVDYRLSHWLGFLVWGILALILHRESSKSLPDSDPYLLPAAALLSGWGLMTIWRLDSTFGMRQLAWLSLSAALVVIVLRLPADLGYLRRYKYLALAGGLLLTTLTLLFGTNPIGVGPRLWLGCCGVYFQPSEPLKLLLVIYLAAYFADRFHVGAFGRSRLALILPLAMPTLVMTGLALAILLIQRDLGTASIFLVLYTILLFAASGKRRVLLVTASGLILAALVGYFFIDIIHVRLVAWLDPWTDPSGRSYQIIQSLLAIANGGTFGRGPGLGAPGLVPVAISDFVFAALTEETGLLGAIALLALFGLMVARGLRAALLAPDRFRRLLAAGLTAYLGVQALLILGGNLRLLPLTGVTLPFVSYGGSSLVTSFIAVVLLLRVGGQPDEEPAALPDPRPYPLLGGFFLLSLTAAALATGWWAVVRGPDLLTRTDNARRSIADRYVSRGDLLDQRNTPITVTRGETGSFVREYLYPALAPVT